MCCYACGAFCQGLQLVSTHCTLFVHNVRSQVCPDARNGVATCAGSVVLTQTYVATQMPLMSVRMATSTSGVRWWGWECDGCGVGHWDRGDIQRIHHLRTHGLPPTTTYQEVVVDSYTNLKEGYQCDAVLPNGTGVASNNHSVHTSECEHEVQLQYMQTSQVMKSYMHIHMRVVRNRICVCTLVLRAPVAPRDLASELGGISPIQFSAKWRLYFECVHLWKESPRSSPWDNTSASPAVVN